MGERVQAEKSKTQDKEEITSFPNVDSKERLKDDLDALLDEIDSVLEENAEEFVAQYVQKGGE